MSRPVALADGENGDRQRFDHFAEEGDHAPVVAVGDMAGEQEESGHRDELHEPDQAEMERAAGQRVHLPADRDDLDLQRDRGRDPHIEKADKSGMAQQRQRRGWLSHGRPL